MSEARNGELLAGIPADVTLYLAAPSNCEDAIREVVAAGDLQVHEPDPRVFTANLTAVQLQSFSSALANKLGPDGLEASRCWLGAGRVDPGLCDLMNTQSLSKLVAWLNGLWLADIIREERLITYFQPIVRASDPEQVYGYECLLRGREPDGGVIPPGRLFTAARDTDLLTALDHVARMTAIRSFTQTEAQMQSCVFINMNPRSIRDPLRCLQSTLRATLSSGISPDRFVFEVVESDQIEDLEGLTRILDHCREAGCRVALDDIGAGYNSLTLLSMIKPDFIKLDMELIRNVDRDPYKGQVAGKLLEMARDLDVRTVAEGIETEGEWKWSARNGADFVQGFFFSRPAADPPRVQMAHTFV